jgi:hypothetical protein
MTAHALAGCGFSTPAQKAEQRYALVATNGTYEDKCVAARKVADLYLQRLEEDQYWKWKSKADSDCHNASEGLLF